MISSAFMSIRSSILSFALLLSTSIEWCQMKPSRRSDKRLMSFSCMMYGFSKFDTDTPRGVSPTEGSSVYLLCVDLLVERLDVEFPDRPSQNVGVEVVSWLLSQALANGAVVSGAPHMVGN
jgi:hypothetical protein